jgi:divalent metal cation (Fe/Co/Zn/Cd) transporter
MALIISLVMSLVMSFTMVAINVGFAEHFFHAWIRSELIGFIVGLPTAMIAVPIARKIVFRITDSGGTRSTNERVGDS